METHVPHSQIRATEVQGANVYNPDGEHIGNIDDIVISKVEGKAQYAIMSFGGFLGIGEEFHPLPWAGLTYDPDKGGYVVNVTRDQLEGAPRFDKRSEPDWNDRDWGAKVHSYYGYPPMI